MPNSYPLPKESSTLNFKKSSFIMTPQTTSSTNKYNAPLKISTLIAMETTLDTLNYFSLPDEPTLRIRWNSTKNLIRNNISPNESNNKIKLIVYHPKFNTSNPIYYNLSPLTSYLSKTNKLYQLVLYNVRHGFSVRS